LFRTGRVAEAVQQARAEIQTDLDPAKSRNTVWRIAELVLDIARWEAQRGNRDAADQALDEARRAFDGSSSRPGSTEMEQMWAEAVADTERQVRLAFGEDATVYAMSTSALPRLDSLEGALADRDMRARLLHARRQDLEEAARSALNLGRFGDAEAAARALLSLHSEIGDMTAHFFLDQPDDLVWGRVLLAQAAAAQGHDGEALKTLEPVLAQYLDEQAQGAAHVMFRQHFARALYVQALAQPCQPARESLDQAYALLAGLTDEAKDLHDSKELLSWISAARKKPNQAAPTPPP
jgi:hypothetical protein